MASVEFKNNAQSTIADNPLTAGATTLNITTGEGVKFPSAFPFKITLWDASMYPNPGNDSGMEIVKCTARTVDALTIVRAQEGTFGVEHSNGERVAMLITAGHFNDAVTGIITKLDTVETNAKDDQIASEVPNTPAGDIVATNVQAAITELDTEKVAKSGDIMTGDLDQGGNYLINSASINALDAKGAGYWFDNVDDYISIASDASITPKQAVMFESVFYVTDDTYGGLISSKILQSSYLFGAVSLALRASKFRFYIANANASDGAYFPIADYIGTIIHLIGTYDKENIKLYINGVLKHTYPYTGVISPTGGLDVGRLGWHGHPYQYFDTDMEQARVWNRVPSESEIKALSSGAPVCFADIGANETLIVPSDDCADDDTANWTDVNGALTFDTDHYVYTVATGASVASFTDEAALTVGKRYRATVLVKDGTGVGSTVRINSLTNADVVIENGTSITVDGTYATASVEWIATETNNKVQVEIIAGSVSDGETILFDDIETNQIGCVLQLEQDGIGHDQWLDKSGNENHGAVSGATPINLECNHIERYEQVVAMTDDTAWTNIVPAGYELEKIVFVESAGNAATLDLGKTSGASDVFSQVVIAASGITTKTIDKSFSMSAAQSLYLNDDGVGTWNGASVTATLFMRRVGL